MRRDELVLGRRLQVAWLAIGVGICLTGCGGESDAAITSSREMDISRVIHPVALLEVMPVYPEWALDQGSVDTVEVMAYLGLDSCVKKLVFTRPAKTASFDSSVAKALRASRFAASGADGGPAEGWFTRRYNFAL